jgi:hypothetical protein
MDKRFKNQVEMDLAVGFYDSGIKHADQGKGASYGFNSFK